MAKIQIQHLLKLNLKTGPHVPQFSGNSNTTFVKVKFSFNLVVMGFYHEFKYNIC